MTKSISIFIEIDLKYINKAHNIFKEFAVAHNFDKDASRKVEIVIDEVLSNIIKYGFPNKDKNSTIEVTFDLIAPNLKMTFTDYGVEFNPLYSDQIEHLKNGHEDNEGGWGILIMKNLVDRISYQRMHGQNHLVIEKNVIL